LRGSEEGEGGGIIDARACSKKERGGKKRKEKKNFFRKVERDSGKEAQALIWDVEVSMIGENGKSGRGEKSPAFVRVLGGKENARYPSWTDPGGWTTSEEEKKGGKRSSPSIRHSAREILLAVSFPNLGGRKQKKWGEKKHFCYYSWARKASLTAVVIHLCVKEKKRSWKEKRKRKKEH